MRATAALPENESRRTESRRYVACSGSLDSNTRQSSITTDVEPSRAPIVLEFSHFRCIWGGI